MIPDADPMRVVPCHLPPRPAGRVVGVGADKASARMAEAVGITPSSAGRIWAGEADQKSIQ